MDKSTFTFALIAFTVDFLIRIFLIFYIPRGRKPTSATAWLLAIFLLPGFIGLFLFLLIGSTRLSRLRRERQKIVDDLIASATKNLPNQSGNDRYTPLIIQNRNLSKMPAIGGNDLSVLSDYQQTIDSIVRDVDAARHYVYIESYITSLDATTEPLFDAMARAIKRGVKVHVLFDAFGSKKYKQHAVMKEKLTEIGVVWTPMLPPTLRPKYYNRPDLRNHRKLIAIDNAVGYIGSLNLIEPRYERTDTIIYEELVARIEGPIVRQTAAIIAGDWYSETGDAILDFQALNAPKAKENLLFQLVPSGSAYENDNNLKLFLSLIYTAKKKIVITNPYLVPDESLRIALISAVQRDVEVVIINSAAVDQWMVGHAQRSYYTELLDAGVQIYLHKTPTLLHAKHITIDNDIAMIGSSNMDIRSFELNLECVLVAYSPKVVKQLQRIQRTNLTHSELLTVTKWKERSTWASFLDSVARLTSALQ